MRAARAARAQPAPMLKAIPSPAPNDEEEIRARVRLGELVSLREIGPTPVDEVSLERLRAVVQRKANGRARKARG